MKKRIYLFAILLIGVITLNAQDAKKVDYFNGNFNDALKASFESGKPLFVEGYTEWCYYCKKLSRNTMTDNDVANYLNENYVTLKLNMETDDGKRIAEMYGITGYPTLLLFSEKGKMSKKIVGYHSSKKLLAKLK